MTETTTRPWLALVESNTTGSGRWFCSVAKDLGFRPVVLTQGLRSYPYLATDHIDVRKLDTGDPTAVLAQCRDLAAGAGLVGVTSSSEYFIATAATVALELGLTGPEPAAVERCRDKSRQRELLSAAGVPVPVFHAVHHPSEAVSAAEKIGFPVVVKPVSGSGSEGVRRCDEPAEVQAAAEAISGRLLVEEYADGPEFSVETFDRDVVAVIGKHLGSPPHFIETGHDVPARLDAASRDRIGTTALAALAALGLGWGPAHTELRMTPRGPVIIEVNPRLAGGMIPLMLAAATNVDLVRLTIARVAGGKPESVVSGSQCGAIRFLVAGRACGVTAVGELSEVRAMPGVVAAEVTVAEGDRIELRNSFKDRIGYLLATGDDGDQAADRAEVALGRMAGVVECADD